MLNLHCRSSEDLCDGSCVPDMLDKRVIEVFTDMNEQALVTSEKSADGTLGFRFGTGEAQRLEKE